MCDYHPTDQQPTQTQTQLVTECEIDSDSSSVLDLEQNLDDPVWARLFPLQSGFSPIGIYDFSRIHLGRSNLKC
jgi:hypothetical protein